MKRLALIALLASSAAVSQIRPAVTGSDPMHQTVAFADGQTVVLEVAPGFQLTVELDRNEQIRSAAAGDSAAWQVVAPERARQFFVRPAPGAVPTNLTVVTNRHTYYFLLVATPQMTSGGALSVRFSYPQQRAAAPEKTDQQPGRTSGSYKVSGASSIRPSLVWDDGSKTYLNWPEEVEAPAIFSIDSSGNESLVNYQYRDGRFVIDAVYTRLLFRLDRLTARADRKAGKS